MRSLSEATAKIASRSFERKYIALGRIVKHWDDIVGHKLADKAQPVKIHYRKKPGARKPDATLEVAASSAHATLLHYQKDLILERINQIFGERWIVGIRFVSTPMNSQHKAGKWSKKTKRPLTDGEKKTLSDMVLEIEDEEMRLRLKNLGQAIITDE